jgi:CDGSH-type Zn-finger protein
MSPITIQVNENGPYLIQGDDAASVARVDHIGKVVVPTEADIELCRVGTSVSTPSCDGTHSRIGFTGAGEARREFHAKKGGE